MNEQLTKKSSNSIIRAGARVPGTPGWAGWRKVKSMTKSQQKDKQKHVIALAAGLVRQQGYENTTVRDIASAAGMLPGSLYYHFPSKADLLYEIHRRGMGELRAGAIAAIDGIVAPWERLEAACATHVQMILEGEEHIGVAVFSLPKSDPDLLNRLTAARDSYEDIYRQLIAELPLSGEVDRKHLRLALLGALNYTEVWHGEGSLQAHEIGRKICELFRFCLEHGAHTADSAVAKHAALIEQAMNLDHESGEEKDRGKKIITAAAHLFANRGYKSSSMRDIGDEAGLEAGSIYYHFKSKSELFIAIVDEALKRRRNAIELVFNDIDDPWEKLEVTCAIHLLFLLSKNDFATIISQPTGSEDTKIWDRIIKVRDGVEQEFKGLIDALELPEALNTKLYLFVLLGAINTVHIWYRSHRDGPAQIAHHIVSMLHPGE